MNPAKEKGRMPSQTASRQVGSEIKAISKQEISVNQQRSFLFFPSF
jgi:hypothetical protein